MSFHRLIASRSIVAAAIPALVLVIAGTAALAQSFPLGQVLVLEAPRIGSLKRVPVITTETDGSATIDLWCKTVPARLTVEGAALRIETAPLPDALPLYMMSGQCTDERIQADVATLAALTQVSGWQRHGDRVALSGPDGAPALRFSLSSH